MPGCTGHHDRSREISADARHDNGSVELTLAEQRRRTGTHAITVSGTSPHAATLRGQVLFRNLSGFRMERNPRPSGARRLRAFHIQVHYNRLLTAAHHHGLARLIRPHRGG